MAKDSSDHNLKAAISDLYDEVLNTKERVLELDEENRRLKEQLARNGDIEGPDETNGYFFFKDRPDNPLCPRAFEDLP